MYAVIASGGKQHKVSAGELVQLEKLSCAVGEKISFDQVLLTGEGTDLTVGSPYLDNTRVEAEVIAHERAKKIHVIKMRRRKRYLRKQGHRQSYTQVRITGITER